MRHIDTEIGTVFVSGHAYDRMERHGIDTDYVERLFEAADGWRDSGGRAVADVEADGVVWRLVLDVERDDELRHDWDLVTVAPTSVDVDAAVDAGLGETTAINLALYCN